MIKIGLVGEAPHDTKSMQNLLEKKYSSSEFEFISLFNRFSIMKHIRGGELDNKKNSGFLRKAYEWNKPNIVIFIRDLDSDSSDKEKIVERKAYFSKSNSIVDRKGVFLIHIFEIEALILADIDTFNLEYNANIPFVSNPMEVKDPKEYLCSNSKGYKESHNSKLFEKLDFNKTLRCDYFKKFIIDFDKRIAQL